MELAHPSRADRVAMHAQRVQQHLGTTEKPARGVRGRRLSVVDLTVPCGDLFTYRAFNSVSAAAAHVEAPHQHVTRSIYEGMATCRFGA